MSDSAAKAAWIKENTTFIGLRLNHNTDADILSYIEGKAKQTVIKELLREALAARKAKEQKQ